MVATNALSEQDLAAVRTEVSAGTPVTVWFTAAAVGVPAGGSAKVVAIDDTAEGDFIQVKPAGTRDTVFCSPGELTRTRPPRKRARQQAEPSPAQSNGSAGESPRRPTTPAAEASAATANPATASPERAAEASPANAGPAKASPEKARPAKVSPAKAPAERTPMEKSPAEKAPARARGGGRPSARPAEVVVTLNASADGEWTVEVAVGRKRTVRPTPVQPGDVAKAARALPSAVAEAIESSLESARKLQIERVERLRAELDAAQRALQELSG